MIGQGISDHISKREQLVERIRALLAAVGMTEAQLNRKIDDQLQTDGGLDVLGFAKMEKIIVWLDGKRSAVADRTDMVNGS